MKIIPMHDLKNTAEVERRCAEENGPIFVPRMDTADWLLWTLIIMKKL